MHNSPPSEPTGEVLPPAAEARAPEGEGPLPNFAVERAQAEDSVFAHPPAHRGRPTPSVATWTLLGINVGVYLWMVLHGVSATSPTADDLVRFGANATDVTIAGQWYRVLTATFVHVGIIHLATNMWCLYNLGLLGEPLLGRWGLVATYLVTGIAGNLLSLLVNVVMHNLSVGAGASGAVFGIAGVLIVLLRNRRLPIPRGELDRLRRSVMQFAGLNLVIGLGTAFTDVIHIDNMAHIGGFLSGLALGPPLLPRMTSGRRLYLQRQKITFAVAALGLLLFAHWIASLR